MNIFKLIIKTLKLLNSNASPWQLSAGLTLGMLLGLTPGFPLQDFVIILLILVLNVHCAAAVFAAVLFGLLGLLLTPVFHQIGYALLVGIPALTPFWTTLYNAPLIPFTHFYNTVTLGATLVGWGAAFPALVLFKIAIVRYRNTLQQKMMKWKVLQALNVGNWLNLGERIGG